MTDQVKVEGTQEERAIIVQDFDVRGTALELYGGRELVRELTGRLLGLHSAAREVGEPGMKAVAQLAILVGANPLPSTNEIHVWVQGGKIMIDLGINYFRRRANELGGIYWVDEPRIMSEAECQQYAIDPKQQIGAICKGARKDKIRQDLTEGYPFEKALGGNLRTGIGTVSRAATPKQGRPLSWTALKAAEKDLCRELFPNLERPDDPGKILEVVPKVEPSDQEWAGKTLNGEAAESLAWLKANTAEARRGMDAMTPGELQAKAAANDRLLNGDPAFEGFDDLPTRRPTPIFVASAAYLVHDVEPGPLYDPEEPPLTDAEYYDRTESPPEAPPEPAREVVVVTLPPEPPPSSPAGDGAPARPALAEDIRAYLRKKAGWEQGQRLLQGDPISDAQKGGLAGLVVDAVKKRGMSQALLDKARYDVLDYLFTVRSCDALYKREASALISWWKSTGAGPGWSINGFARMEADRILEATAKESGQLDMGL